MFISEFCKSIEFKYINCKPKFKFFSKTNVLPLINTGRQFTIQYDIFGTMLAKNFNERYVFISVIYGYLISGTYDI